MASVYETEVFSSWLLKLKDRRAKARLLVRIESMRLGHTGDTRYLGAGLYELRIHYGPGYRIYIARQAGGGFVLLCGGIKAGQDRDIRRARQILANMEGDD